MLKKKARKYFCTFIKSERSACQNRFLITLIIANLTRCYQNCFVKSRRAKFLRVSYIYCIHELSVLNYYFEKFYIMILLNIQRFDVIEWNYLKCIITIDINNIKHIVIVNSARYYKLIKFINKNVNWVIIAEILFCYFFPQNFFIMLLSFNITIII